MHDIVGRLHSRLAGGNDAPAEIIVHQVVRGDHGRGTEGADPFPETGDFVAISDAVSIPGDPDSRPAPVFDQAVTNIGRGAAIQSDTVPTTVDDVAVANRDFGAFDRPNHR